MQIPFTRIAGWLVWSSTLASTMICEAVRGQNLMSEKELQDRLLALCKEIASFYAASTIRLLMDARQESGRENFTMIYKGLEKAISELGRAHDFLRSRIGFTAIAITDFQARDTQFMTALNYFEGNQSGLGVPPQDIDYYAGIYGDNGVIRTLDALCLNALIRTTRFFDRVLIQKNTPIGMRGTNMCIFFSVLLQNEEVGFVGFSEAIMKLLRENRGDKPVSELNSEELVERDMAAFRSSRSGR
jgi:hypothetical protein